MKIKKNKLYLLVSSCLIVSILSGGIIIAKNAVKADDLSKYKENIAKFNNQNLDSIVKFDQIQENNQQIIMFKDSDYEYKVDSQCNIVALIKKNIENYNPQTTVPTNKLVNDAKDILKKLNKENYVLSQIDDSTVSFNSTYSMLFKEKNENGISTGNFVSLQLFKDGQLKSLVWHKEDSSISNITEKISKEQAKSIVFNYINNKKLLNINTDNLTSNVDLLTLSDNKYYIEKNTFKNKLIWDIYIKTDKSEGFTLRYMVDANTGEILKKIEPTQNDNYK